MVVSKGAHRTHAEEFYEVYECSWNVTELNPELTHWEYIYDCVRPHQALNYKTPLQFLRDSGIVDSTYPRICLICSERVQRLPFFIEEGYNEK
jgi:hypothetical protein